MTADRKPRFWHSRTIGSSLAAGAWRLTTPSGGGGIFGRCGSGWRRKALSRHRQLRLIQSSWRLAWPGMPGVVVRSINRASGEPNWETIVWCRSPRAARLPGREDARCSSIRGNRAAAKRWHRPPEFIAAPWSKLTASARCRRSERSLMARCSCSGRREWQRFSDRLK